MKITLIGLLAVASVGFLLRGGQANGSGTDTEIDPEVQRLMDRDPDSRHDLILTIRLARTPVSIRELRATNAERNVPADYTGAGVKVAIVDGGYDKDHPRLPELEEENEFDASEQGGVDVCGHSHGSLVAGVVFCQPDEDDRVGIAYGATPVIAKIYSTLFGGGCQPVAQTWSLDLDAFTWSSDPEGVNSTIINFSQGEKRIWRAR